MSSTVGAHHEPFGPQTGGSLKQADTYGVPVTGDMDAFGEDRMAFQAGQQIRVMPLCRILSIFLRRDDKHILH
ncbi:MAG TPA: hypothetical protein VLZ84_09435 [Asticcacaulis sp.]|nr:hypothetical protein [Asticcacaulis sp.]